MDPVQEALEAYAALVREWAPKLDLVAPGDLERFRERHIEDSLRLLPLLGEAPEGPCIDVGSGAGLPGVPLAIVSGRHWRLLEPRKKRAAFLDEVVRSLGLDCEVLSITAEQAAKDPQLERAQAVATARALAAPDQAAGLLRPLLMPDGIGAIYLGERATPPRETRLWAPGIAIVEGTAPEPPE